jgi:hypothetical protein
MLIVASLMLLVGAGVGCGDDSTSNAGVDMAVGMDMTAVAHDMAQLSCLQVLMCARSCTTLTCAQNCLAEGKPAAQTAANDLLTCVSANCMADGGTDPNCAMTVAYQAVTGNGPCATQGVACTQN